MKLIPVIWNQHVGRAKLVDANHSIADFVDTKPAARYNTLPQLKLA